MTRQALTDAQMDAHYTLRGYDGRWSLTTALTMIALNARGFPLYLNYLWAATPQAFRCPVCRRGKPYLMRKVRGRVLAYLCIDHDHVMDYIDEAGAKGNKVLYDRFMSFRPLIMCNQCNTIDSALKGMLPSIHRSFTFTPEQKSLVFKPYKTSGHWINFARGEAIWRSEEAGFCAKLREIDAVCRTEADAAAASSAWQYQRYIDEELKLGFTLKAPPPAEGGESEYFSFIQRSIAGGERAALLLHI